MLAEVSVRGFRFLFLEYHTNFPGLVPNKIIIEKSFPVSFLP
jgi:hypothetical protein